MSQTPDNMPAARNKRTRQGTVDDPVLPAADVWEVGNFLARATGKHGKKYLTRWKGFDSKADIYEPESNLLGSKELLAQFNKEQDALVEADHKAAKEKKRSTSKRWPPRGYARR